MEASLVGPSGYEERGPGYGGNKLWLIPEHGKVEALTHKKPPLMLQHSMVAFIALPKSVHGFDVAMAHSSRSTQYPCRL